MKKSIASLIMILILLLSLNINSYAISATDSKEKVIMLENGEYIVETVTEEVASERTTNTKNGQKTIKVYDSDNKLLWSATLKGTFTYTGSRATCTASSITYTVYNDNWKITSATASKSGNTATGNITGKRYALGIPIKTVERAITLTCSSSGVLS